FNCQALLDLIVRRLSDLIGDSCLIRLIDEGSEWISLEGSVYHPDPEVLRDIRSFLLQPQRLGEGVAGVVAVTRVPALLPIISTEEMIARAPPEFRPMVERV